MVLRQSRSVISPTVSLGNDTHTPDRESLPHKVFWVLSRRSSSYSVWPCRRRTRRYAAYLHKKAGKNTGFDFILVLSSCVYKL